MKMLLALLPLLLVVGSARSATWNVPDDFPTITQAVAAASPGDQIDVDPGTYAEPGSITLTFPLTLVSTGGADVTTLDGGGVRRILDVQTAGVMIRGFTFFDGTQDDTLLAGGGIRLAPYAGIAVEDCVFRRCAADHAGAIYGGTYSSAIVRRCLFEENSSTVTGGASYFVLGAEVHFEDCLFRDNTTVTYAGVAQVHRATMHFARCLFVGNRSSDVSGALYFGTLGLGSVESCTFFDHTSPGFNGGTIVAGTGVTITRSIFAGDTHGYGVHWYTGEGDHSCNVFWDNADGAMSVYDLDPTETVVDPQFCDPDAGNFEIRSTSPAAADHSPSGCSLIGALPVGCGPVSVEPLSWGRIKAAYGNAARR